MKESPVLRIILLNIERVLEEEDIYEVRIGVDLKCDSESVLVQGLLPQKTCLVCGEVLSPSWGLALTREMWRRTVTRVRIPSSQISNLNVYVDRLERRVLRELKEALVETPKVTQLERLYTKGDIIDYPHTS